MRSSAAVPTSDLPQGESGRVGLNPTTTLQVTLHLTVAGEAAEATIHIMMILTRSLHRSYRHWPVEDWNRLCITLQS